MLESLINHNLFYSIALTLLHFIWQGGLIALFLKAILMTTAVSKARLRYAFSTLAMSLNLLVPTITFYLIYQNKNLTAFAHYSELVTNSSPSNIAFYFLDKLNISLLLPYLAIAWLTVIVILSVKLITEFTHVNRLPLTQTQQPNLKLQRRFKALAADIGLQRLPRLLISLKVDVPMALGFIKPVVLIPVSMLSGLTPAQLDMLLLHELAHIRRHDYLVNFIQTLIEILFFYHPCCYWVSKQMRKEREHCSDDIAIQHCCDPIAYAHTLTDTASLCSHRKTSSIPAMAMAATGGDLTLRIKRLVQQPNCSHNHLFSKWMAASSILSVIIACAYLVPLSSTTQVIKRASSTIPFNTKSYNASLTFAQSNYADDLFQTKIHSNITKQPSALSLIVKKISKPESLKQINPLPQSNVTAQKVANRISVPITQKVTKTVLNTQTTSSNAINTQIQKTNNKPLINPERVNDKAISFTKTDINPTLPQSKVNDVVASLNETSDQSIYNELEAINNALLSAEHLLSSSGPSQLANTFDLSPQTMFEKIDAAELIKVIEPRYPAQAKQRGLELDVLVNFTINTDGRVKDIEFTAKGRSSYFKSAIRTAMKKWRYIPAQVGGKPVESTMKKVFSFNLVS